MLNISLPYFITSLEIENANTCIVKIYSFIVNIEYYELMSCQKKVINQTLTTSSATTSAKLDHGIFDCIAKQPFLTNIPEREIKQNYILTTIKHA